MLEGADIGAGASGRNGGQVVPGLKYDPEDLLRIDGSGRLLNFAARCADDLFAFIRDRQLRCDASQSGWLQPAATEAQLRVVRHRADQWKHAAQVEIRLLGRDEVSRATGAEGYLGGWIDPRGGRLQPLSYARELARAVSGAGGMIACHSPVHALARTNGGWRLSCLGHKVDAGEVIVATNAYAGNLIQGLAKSYFAAHSVQMATEPLPAALRRSILPAGVPVSDARRLLKYFRLDRDGRFLIGGRGSFGRSERGRYFAGLQKIAERIFPQLQGMYWSHRWAGKIALTLDHLPHLHIPAPGLYAALGFNGRGVAMASSVGVLLGQLSLGMAEAESPLPVRPINRIPLHSMRRPAMEIAGAWYRLLDKLEA